MCPTVRLLLYIVAASLVYLLLLVLRRRERRLLGFALLAAGNLVLAAGALATGTECRLPGLLALFVFGLAVVVPAMLRAGEVRALTADRLRLAMALGAVRALLQPGAGVGEELALRRRLLAVRSGQGDAVFAALRAAIAAAPTEAQRVPLREQLILLLVQDRRFADAVADWETRPLPIETRPVLGAAIVRALGEIGRLADAAEVLRQLEEGPAQRDASALAHVNQARLVYLAFAGELLAVDALLAGTFVPELPEATRAFWVGTAAMNAGNTTKARESFQQARALASGPLAPRLRALCEARLAALDEPRTPPIVDPAFTAIIAARARQVHGLARRRVHWRDVPVTLTMAALNAAVFAAARIAHLQTNGQLIRWGANYHPFVVERYQYWRLLTSAFLHIDWLHILSNLYVLILLGRLVEPLFGSRRYVVIYLVSAITGSIGSVLGARGDLSIGASGAIFGVLGALLAMLLRRRGAFPEALRRTLLFNLLVLLLLQVLIDWRVEFIDNWAHLGGLIGGFALGLVLDTARRPEQHAAREGEGRGRK